MPETLALATLAAPAALLGVGIAAIARPGARPAGLLALARGATLLALALAVATAVALAVAGPATSPLIGAAGLGLSVRIDALSVTLFLMIAFLGAIVVEFSRNYMDGDARQGAFTGWLAATLAAVMLLVLAGNLGQLVAAWIAMSLALHRLLVFYPGRPKAVLAARKKFVSARIGDLCLVAAAVLIARAFGTTDIAGIAEAAAAAGAAPAGVGWAAGLIALAALLKSAQFPAHGWIAEVMETPTPVSALLHAGIVNAGGVLVLRFADVMLLAPGAMVLLAAIGGATALIGSVVMLTQPAVKASLAWSTISQMGLMLFQCGIGVFALALLHIVAHSLYKAHAFLAAGSAVEAARATRGAPGAAPRAPAIAGAVALAVLVPLGVGALIGPAQGGAVQTTALAAILAMGLAVLVGRAAAAGAEGALLARVGAAALGLSVLYFGLQAGARALLGPVLPPVPAPGPATLAVLGAVLLAFAAVTLAQLAGPALLARPGMARLRVHLANGLYANTLFDRLVGAPGAPRPQHQ